MSDVIDPAVLEVRRGVARAIWASTRNKPEGETVEARKAAWAAESKDAMKLAARVLRKLESGGYKVTKTEA